MFIFKISITHEPDFFLGTGGGGGGIFGLHDFFFRPLLVQDFVFRVKPSAKILLCFLFLKKKNHETIAVLRRLRTIIT